MTTDRALKTNHFAAKPLKNHISINSASFETFKAKNGWLFAPQSVFKGSSEIEF